MRKLKALYKLPRTSFQSRVINYLESQGVNAKRDSGLKLWIDILYGCGLYLFQQTRWKINRVLRLPYRPLDKKVFTNYSSEIAYNLHQIIVRMAIVVILLYRKLNRRALKNQDKCLASYEKHWSTEKQDETVRTDLYYTFYDQPVYLSRAEYHRLNTTPVLCKWIDILNPKNVLEVGCGGGRNLSNLSKIYPNIDFVGIEPTRSGVETSRENNPSPNVKIVLGSALELPFEDKQFDLVFTVAVIEQLNNYYAQAIQECIRVAKYFLFHEEFLEAQHYIEHYKYLVERDYFRQSWNIFNKPDIKILSKEIPPYQPSWLKYGVVVGFSTERTPS